MVRQLFRVSFVCLFISFSSQTASAAPLDAELLPKETKWVVHIDYEAFSDSTLAERVRSRRPEMVSSFQKWCEDHCGISPQKDVESLTLFSDDYTTHSGAAVFRGDFDTSKVASHLKEKRDVKTTESDGHTYYTWKMPHGHGHSVDHIKKGAADQETNRVSSNAKQAEKAETTPNLPDTSGDQEVTAVLLDGKQAVLAGSLERAKQVVALIAGDVPTLKEDSELIADMPEGAIVYGAAIDLGDISQHERPFPILSQHKSAKWLVGEREDQMFETLVLVANERSVAREVETALEGLVALGKLWAGDLETLSEIYDDTEISRTRTTVKLEWQGDVDDVMTALDELQPRFQAWRQYKSKMR